MVINSKKNPHWFAAILFAFAVGDANACTLSEDMQDSVPLNSTQIPNVDLLKIADMVHNARQWPDVEIRGIVNAGGYVKEKNPERLAQVRGANLRDYLVQLGLKPENIAVETHKVTAPYPVDSAGYGGLLQIGVTLVPLCEGDCTKVCDDPRVKRTTRAVK